MHLLSVRKRLYCGMKCLYDSSKPKSWKHSATAHAFSLQSELKALHRKREKTEILHSIIGTLSSRLKHPWHVSSLLSIWINIVCWQCHAWYCIHIPQSFYIQLMLSDSENIRVNEKCITLFFFFQFIMAYWKKIWLYFRFNLVIVQGLINILYFIIVNLQTFTVYFLHTHTHTCKQMHYLQHNKLHRHYELTQ